MARSLNGRVNVWDPGTSGRIGAITTTNHDGWEHDDVIVGFASWDPGTHRPSTKYAKLRKCVSRNSIYLVVFYFMFYNIFNDLSVSVVNWQAYDLNVLVG